MKSCLTAPTSLHLKSDSNLTPQTLHTLTFWTSINVIFFQVWEKKIRITQLQYSFLQLPSAPQIMQCISRLALNTLKGQRHTQVLIHYVKKVYSIKYFQHSAHSSAICSLLINTWFICSAPRLIDVITTEGNNDPDNKIPHYINWQYSWWTVAHYRKIAEHFRHNHHN